MTKKKHFTGLINVLLINPFQTQGADYKLLKLNVRLPFYKGTTEI